MYSICHFLSLYEKITERYYISAICAEITLKMAENGLKRWK